MIARTRVVLLWICVLFSAANVAAQRLPERRIVAGDVPNEYIVGLRGVPRDEVDRVARQIAANVGGQVVTTWKDAVTGFWIRVPDARAAEMYRDARVASVEQNATMVDSATQSTMADPAPIGAWPEKIRDHPLWHLARISHRARGPRTYMYQSAGTGVRAYTLDGGALRFHQEFVTEQTPATRRLNPLDSPRMREESGSNAVMTTGGADQLPSTAPNADCSAAPPFAPLLGQLRYASTYPWFNRDPLDKAAITDHGTGVNSVLGGRNVGVAKDVTLVPVKTNGCGPTSTIAAAIEGANWILKQEQAWAAARSGGRRFAVVSISVARGFGPKATESMAQVALYEMALEALVGYGIPVFASANNFNEDACDMSPARMSRRGGKGTIITVGGLARGADQRWKDTNPKGTTNGSNFGPCVDIVAPAEDIPVAYSTGWADYRPLVLAEKQSASGTSYSAPMVAGIAARMMSEDESPEIAAATCQPGRDYTILREKLTCQPAKFSEEIWKRLIASATVLPEPDDSSKYGLGDNSPNRIAYMGSISFVTHPQSYDFPAAVANRTLQAQVPPGITVCKYQWYESTSADYSLGQAVSGANSPFYIVARPTAAAPTRKWYWVRAYSDCANDEYADSAMAAMSTGYAVVQEQPKSVWRDTASDEKLRVTVQAGTTTPTIEWYRGVRGKLATTVTSGILTKTNPDGSFTSELTVAAEQPNDTYWAQITSNGVSIDSDVAQVRRCLAPDMTGVQIEYVSGHTITDPGPRLVPAPKNAVWYQLWLHEPGENNVVQRRLVGGNSLPQFEVKAGQPSTFTIEALSSCGNASVSSELIVPRDCSSSSAEPPTASPQVVYKGERVTLSQEGLLSMQVTDQDRQRYGWRINNGVVFRTWTNQLVQFPTTHTTYFTVAQCGNQAPAFSAEVKVYVRPEITKQPESTLLSSDTGVILSGQGVDVSGAPVTYQWYEQIGHDTAATGDKSKMVALTDTTQLAGTRTDSLTTKREGVFFLRVTSSLSPNAFTDTKRAYVTIPCGPPRRRSVRSSSTTDDIPPGSALTLSVEDDGDGTKFQWFEGTSYGDESRPVPGTSTAIVVPNSDTSYWVKMTRTCDSGSASEVTPIVDVTVQCDPVILVHPQSVTVATTTGSAQVSASVVAGGKLPLDYQWSELDANGVWRAIPTSNVPAFTWTMASPGQKKVRVKVTGCNTFVESDAVTLTVITGTPQRIGTYTEMKSVYSPLIGATLSVDMVPAPQTDVHQYQYEWFTDDGTPTGARITGSASSNTVTTDSIANFWVRVTGTHTVNGIKYTEVTTSPKMNVYLYGTCALPPVRVTQNVQSVAAGSTSNVIFTAAAEWHDVRFQWYRGQSGDTRDPVPSDAGKPHQLTVSSASVRPYWVRAWLECGGTQDSPTLIFTRGTCAPILMNQNINSSEVAYGGTALLTVDQVSGPVTYTWYRQTTGNIGAGSGIVHHPTDVRQSRRYFVRVQNSACGTMAESYLATVRVASCSTLTPPAWQTEVWANSKSSLVLNAQTGGATAYQWYRGEVGDETQKIEGAISATYTIPSVTADAQYWVRVTNGNCLVDSPTIQVKVCIPPGVSTAPSLNRNIIPNQSVSFSVNGEGTGITYQWYRGVSGDTSTPAGRPVDMLQVSPSVTTSYWLRITGKCGIGGGNVRRWDSPTFTASVCPSVPAPVAAKSAVMPGATTTISVAATGTSLSYQWYRGVAGSTADPIAGGTSNTITTPPITAATPFWVDVTSGGCSRNSTAVTVNLCSEPTVRWSGGDKSIATGDNVTFTAIGTHSTTTPTYTFYKGNVGDVAGSTVVRAASTSNSFSSIVNATGKYWVRATVDNCYADSGNLNVTVCIPKITTQPSGGAITLGGSRTLSVATDITPSGGYQWYMGETGDLSKPVANGTTASIPVSPAEDTKYWVRVKGCSPYGADSTAVLVTVCTPPQITSHTQSRWITQGQSHTLSVAFTGTSPTVQWYRGAAGNTTTPIASPAVTPNATTQYWARVSNSCGSADTPTITISVCAAPVIGTQPASQGVLSGSTATLSVGATQATSTPMTYQWYSGTAPSGTAISGATGTTYTTPPLTAAASYFVKITAGDCTTVSQTATISMCALPPTINSPDDKFVSAYTNVVLKVTLSPTPEQYRWYRGVSGDRTNLIGTSSQVTVNPASTTKYWGEFTHGGCVSIGRTVTVNVCVPSINMHPDSVTIPAGSSTTLTINARDAVSYQWYSETLTGTAIMISGATGPSYTTPELTETTGYWVRVTGSCSRSVNTNVGMVTVE